MSYDVDHPTLPAGYDTAAINGDGMNGSGVNEPIWPVVIEAYQAMTPMIITDVMLDVFVKGCPDYVVPCENSTITMRRDVREVEMKEVA